MTSVVLIACGSEPPRPVVVTLQADTEHTTSKPSITQSKERDLQELLEQARNQPVDATCSKPDDDDDNYEPFGGEVTAVVCQPASTAEEESCSLLHFFHDHNPDDSEGVFCTRSALVLSSEFLEDGETPRNPYIATYVRAAFQPNTTEELILSRVGGVSVGWPTPKGSVPTALIAGTCTVTTGKSNSSRTIRCNDARDEGGRVFPLMLHVECCEVAE